MYTIVYWIGNLLTMTALLVGLLLYGYAEFYAWRRAGLVLILFMQLVVGLFLIYAASLKRRHIDIGEKMYPASIAAALLYLACLLRWLWY